jgi:hypothetical protein
MRIKVTKTRAIASIVVVTGLAMQRPRKTVRRVQKIAANVIPKPKVLMGLSTLPGAPTTLTMMATV